MTRLKFPGWNRTFVNAIHPSHKLNADEFEKKKKKTFPFQFFCFVFENGNNAAVAALTTDLPLVNEEGFGH